MKQNIQPKSACLETDGKYSQCSETTAVCLRSLRSMCVIIKYFQII